MPAWNFYLPPFAILKSLQDTVVKAGFKGYLRASWIDEY
jgi:hypothetical protein